MIHSPETQHRPIRVLFDYFERAIEDLGLGPWFGLLKPGNEDYFRGKIGQKVYSADSSQEARWRAQTKREALRRPEEHLRWEPWEDPEEEILAHYRMQSAIVATLMGDNEALRTLVAQLITEPMNRKLAISYFLGNLTDGQVGLTYKDLPAKAQVLQWVRDSEWIRSTDKLDELARLKYE